VTLFALCAFVAFSDRTDTIRTLNINYITGFLCQIAIPAEVEIVDCGLFADLRDLEEATEFHLVGLDGLTVVRDDLSSFRHQ
jgi:hypothetical protein